MKFYITDRQVPEIATLSFSQRRVVREGAFNLFCQDVPARRWQVRLENGIAIGLGCSAAIISSEKILVQMLAGVLTVSAILMLRQSLLTERLRPYFKRYIEDHRDEFTKAA